MKTLSIQESKPTAVDITPSEALLLNDIGRQLASRSKYWASADEVDLVNERRSIVQCRNDGIRWFLTVHNAVGVIAINDKQILVRPKIPTNHLLFLMSCAEQLPRSVAHEAHVSADDELYELLVHWFLLAQDLVLRRSLLNDYVPVQDELAFTRGQLDPLATAQRYYSGRLDTICLYDEYGPDTPHNRLLKMATVRVIANDRLSSGTRARARRAHLHFQDVGEMQSADVNVLTDRRTAYYKDALQFGRLLLANEGRTIAAGENKAWTFLLPTAGAVEVGIRQILANGLLPAVVENRGRSIGNGLTVNPDLTVESPLAVADVKYRIYDDAWPRPDVYQAVSFASAYRATQSAVISFSHARVPLPPLRFGDITVSALRWDSGPNVTPSDAADRLLRDARQWLFQTVSGAA